MLDRSTAINTIENQIEQYSNHTLDLLENIVSRQAHTHLVRMFRDPYVLEAEERAHLIQQLREAVSIEPKIPSLYVLLGMALCVDLNVQQGLEELRTAVRLAPDNFIARLKLGELLMRLRICSEAAEHTHAAAQVADNALQAELARRQAATIRTMQREGIERGGYKKLTSLLTWAKSRFARTHSPSTTALTSR